MNILTQSSASCATLPRKRREWAEYRIEFRTPVGGNQQEEYAARSPREAIALVFVPVEAITSVSVRVCGAVAFVGVPRSAWGADCSATSLEVIS